jgi:hypothetical protein
MRAVPGEIAHDCPDWEIIITPGLLDVQVPLDPAKLVLVRVRVLPSL